MKAFLLRCNIWTVVLLCGVVVLAITVAGCQTSGKLVSDSRSTVCPLCKTVTRTTAVKGLNYTRHVCPKCRKVRNTGTSDEAAALTEVHVCDHCKAIVGMCPHCAAQ